MTTLQEISAEMQKHGSEIGTLIQNASAPIPAWLAPYMAGGADPASPPPAPNATPVVQAVPKAVASPKPTTVVVAATPVPVATKAKVPAGLVKPKAAAAVRNTHIHHPMGPPMVSFSLI